MPKGVQKRIRNEAKRKLRINITWRLRSKTGFTVEYPGGSAHAASKKEAMSMLLAKLRCFDVARFSVKVAKRQKRELLTEFQGTKLDREMPWCEACQSYHVKPATKAEHDTLKCFAEWKEKV